jgi:hypothetical protein
LVADLLCLPAEASWHEYTAAWKLFLN